MKNKPRKNEITFKEWVYGEMARLNLSYNAVHMRVIRGWYPDLKLRKVNKRLVFVKLPVDHVTV